MDNAMNADGQEGGIAGGIDGSEEPGAGVNCASYSRTKQGLARTNKQLENLPNFAGSPMDLVHFFTIFIIEMISESILCG